MRVRSAVPMAVELPAIGVGENQSEHRMIQFLLDRFQKSR